MRFCAPSKREPGENILKGDDVPFVAFNAFFNAIKCYNMPWVQNFQILRFPELFSSLVDTYFAKVRNLLREHPEAS